MIASMTTKEALAREMIERVADKWTMLVLDALEPGPRRFTRIRDLVGDVSQKMLTKTLRQLERDGLVTRTVYPVVPPHVEYELTKLGLDLAESFCGVWKWAEKHSGKVAEARLKFDLRRAPVPGRAADALPGARRRPAGTRG